MSVYSNTKFRHTKFIYGGLINRYTMDTKIFRDYILCMILIISIIGIPLVLGYFNSVIRNNIVNPDEGGYKSGRFVPILNISVEGVLVLIFTAIPFTVIFFVQGIYAWIVGTYILTGTILFYILSFMIVAISAASFYTVPFFLSMQTLRTTERKRFDELLIDELGNIVGNTVYAKYYGVFFFLTFGFTVISYTGSLNLILYFITIFLTPGYLILSSNLIGIMNREMQSVR